MFGIGGFELFIILIFGFLIFGPEKLPEIAKTVGKGIARFREAQQEMNDTLGGEKIFDPNNPDEPFKDPVEMLDKLAQKQEEKKAAKAAAASPKQGAAAVSSTSATTVKPAAPASAAGEPVASNDASGAEGQAPARQESFTERKARYERERAARKAAEKEAAANASAGEEAGPSQAPASANASASAAPANGAPAAGAQTQAGAKSGSPEAGQQSASADAPTEGGDA